MSDQPQPVRTGDVYPPSASAHDARRQRDEVLGTHGGDQQQNQDGDLRVTEAAEPHAGRRVVTATAGGQVTTSSRFTVHGGDAIWAVHGSRAGRRRGGGDGRGDHRRSSAGRGADVGGRQAGGPRGAAAVQSAEAAPRARASSPAWRPQQRAETNMRPGLAEEDRVRLMDVLGNAAAVMPANKVATREDRYFKYLIFTTGVP
ncbi:hypothetical protein ZWY2020_027847 [Hordeum vulgare]|nr:hypothetical protein ZWY2020_027847 [Hordeum vulgare]